MPTSIAAVVIIFYRTAGNKEGSRLHRILNSQPNYLETAFRDLYAAIWQL